MSFIAVYLFTWVFHRLTSTGSPGSTYKLPLKTHVNKTICQKFTYHIVCLFKLIFKDKIIFKIYKISEQCYLN